MKTFKILALIGIVSFALYSFTSVVQEEWKVPAKYETMKNPTNPKVDLNIGKSLSVVCKFCLPIVLIMKSKGKDEKVTITMPIVAIKKLIK